MSIGSLLTDLVPVTTTSTLGRATAMTGVWQQGRHPPTQGVLQHLRRRKVGCHPGLGCCPRTLVSQRNSPVLRKKFCCCCFFPPSHSIVSCDFLLTAPGKCLEIPAIAVVPTGGTGEMNTGNCNIAP